MMIEQATVVAYKNGIATVQCQAKSSCGGCSAKSRCGTKALSALAGEKTAPRFQIKVEQDLKIGDQIQLGLSEQTLLKSVFLIYGIPLAVLLLTAVVFSQFFANELLVLLAMLVFTGITFCIVKKIIEAHGKQTNYSPVFLGKL